MRYLRDGKTPARARAGNRTTKLFLLKNHFRAAFFTASANGSSVRIVDSFAKLFTIIAKP